MGKSTERLLPGGEAVPDASGNGSATRLIWLCCAANLINAADRVIMPIAIVRLAVRHGYSLHQQAWVLSAFPAGYISSQIVGSCAGSQLGGGRVLLCFVACMWSLATVCTPLVAAHLHLLIVTRVILGLGEGLGLPTIYHIFADSVPAPMRSRAFSYLAAAGSIGQTLAAVVSPHVPWQLPFYAFGSAGFAWCIVWLRHSHLLQPNTLPQPLLCKQTTNPMRQWRLFFSKKPLLAVYLAHFAMNWTSYVVMHWLPTYLTRQFDAQPTDLSLAAAPYVLNSLASIGVGHLADQLISTHRLSLLFVRKMCTVAGLFLPACLLFAFSSISHLYSAIILISLCMAALALNSAGHLSNHADICPRFAGISFAISNTIATLPGLIVGPMTADLVVGSSGRWWPVFVLAAMLDMVAGLVYFSYAHTKPLF